MEGLAEVYEMGLSEERELELVRKRIVESRQDEGQQAELSENVPHLYWHKRQLMLEQNHTAVVSFEVNSHTYIYRSLKSIITFLQ